MEGIASTIRSRPDEPWLIVHHKADHDFDLVAEVRRLAPPGTNIHFLHWGAHDATNDFAHVPNIILAGTLFYRLSHYEALGRLAAARPSSTGRMSEDEVGEIVLGEHAHLLLQALCRGAVRRCEGDGCPVTHAYIIASKGSGIADELPSIFPGATVMPWRPVRKALRGKVAEAVSYISDRLREPGTDFVRFGEVAEAIGWKDRREFKKSIRRHPDFIDALDELGVEEIARSGRPGGYRLVRSDDDN